jgi:hypothetical protein
MGTDPPTCAICLDSIDLSSKYAQPLPCCHTFHCTCMNQWLQQNRSCPLCRYPVKLQDQARWFSLFTTALLVSHDMYIDRFILTTEFLHHILKKYKTSIEWKARVPFFIGFMNHFQHVGVRLPCLDITTRTMAQKELTRWRAMFKAYSVQFPIEKKRRSTIRQVLQTQALI